MKYITSQHATIKFRWQLAVYINSLFNLGIPAEDIIVLFADCNNMVPEYIRNKYHVNVFVFKDNREDKGYIPSIKPYLMYRYLSENPQAQQEDYVYTDSDIVIREPLDFNKLKGDANHWFGSDCGGYLNIGYLNYVSNSQQIIQTMLNTVGIDYSQIKSIDKDCIGAQYVIFKPKADYFEKVYKDSYRLYYATNRIDSNFQTWVAEMYATLWNLPYFNIVPTASKELDFAWATDSAEDFMNCKIYHDAGVIDDKQGLFYKGNYNTREPFKDNFDFIESNTASYYYAKCIKATK